MLLFGNVIVKVKHNVALYLVVILLLDAFVFLHLQMGIELETFPAFERFLDGRNVDCDICRFADEELASLLEDIQTKRSFQY